MEICDTEFSGVCYLCFQQNSMISESTLISTVTTMARDRKSSVFVKPRFLVWQILVW